MRKTLRWNFLCKSRQRERESSMFFNKVYRMIGKLRKTYANASTCYIVKLIIHVWFAEVHSARTGARVQQPFGESANHDVYCAKLCGGLPRLLSHPLKCCTPQTKEVCVYYEYTKRYAHIALSAHTIYMYIFIWILTRGHAVKLTHLLEFPLLFMYVCRHTVRMCFEYGRVHYVQTSSSWRSFGMVTFCFPRILRAFIPEKKSMRAFYRCF